MTRTTPDVAIITGQQPATATGLACPKCGHPIPITLEALLLRNQFRCGQPRCYTTLSLDRGASQRALDHARSLHQNLNRI